MLADKQSSQPNRSSHSEDRKAISIKKQTVLRADLEALNELDIR